MKKIVDRKSSIMIPVLIGSLVFASIFIGLLIYRGMLMYELEKQTYNKILYCMTNNQENREDKNQEIREIISDFESQKQQIQEKTITNSVTSFLITLGAISTNIIKIIKNSQSIYTEYKDDKEKMEFIKIKEEMYNYQKMQEILNEIQKLENESKHPEEREKILKNITMGIVEHFSQILGQTKYFTNQISQDKDELISSIGEIKKGIEQIAQSISEKSYEVNNAYNEEIISAVEQMNTAIEEMGILVLGIEKKAKKIVSNIEKYK